MSAGLIFVSDLPLDEYAQTASLAQHRKQNDELEYWIMTIRLKQWLGCVHLAGRLDFVGRNHTQ